MQIIASGKEEIEALKAEVSALEKQLKEMHDADEKAIVYTQFRVFMNDMQALLRVGYIYL